MGHVPHLCLPRPWGTETIPLAPGKIHHLERVLRLRPGAEVSFTDGHGTLGGGIFRGEGIERSEESMVGRLPELEIAVAPPHERDRLRWLVEKAAELEVSRLRWLKTQYGNARASWLERAPDWAEAALEQSRGAWLLDLDPEWVTIGELDDQLPTVVADPSGAPWSHAPPLRVMIGPEGGWGGQEVPAHWPRANLGRNILRTETAAIAAAMLARQHIQGGQK